MPQLVIVYQPHQNIRQHKVKDQYPDAFKDADKVYWLDTYLSREDKSLRVLTPKEFVADLETKAEVAKLDQNLALKLKSHKKNGDLIVFMGAGDIDDWARDWLKTL